MLTYLIKIKPFCLPLLAGLVLLSFQVAYPKENKLLCDNFDEIRQLESQAKKLALEWKKPKIINAINLLKTSKDCWLNNKETDKALSTSRQIAFLYTVLGENEKAFEIYKKALNLTDSSSNINERIYILSELSLLLLNQGKSDKSKKYLLKVLKLLNNTENNSAKAIAYFSAAEFEYYERNLLDAENLYIKALSFANQGEDSNLKARILLYLGYNYLYKDKIKLAFNTVQNALRMYEKIGDSRGIAFTKIAIANTLNFMNKRQAAITNYRSAELMFPTDLDTLEKARVYNGLASIYELYQDWELAITYRKKALTSFRIAKHKYGELATLSGLGKLNYLSENLDKASKYFNEALVLAKQLDDKFYLAVIFKSFGNLYAKKGYFQKAENQYNKSILLLKTQKATREISLIYDQIGEFYAKNNRLDLSKEYLSKALEIHQKIKNSFSESQTLYLLAYLNSIEKNEEKALNLIEDSLMITENLTSDLLNSDLTQTYFSNIHERYELYIYLLMRMHKQYPNRGFDIKALLASEKSRSRSTLEKLKLTEIKFEADANPQVVNREQEIQNLINIKSEKLTEALSKNEPEIEIKELDNEIKVLNNELAEIKAELKQKSPIYSAIKDPTNLDIRAFQNSVKSENSMLLEFSFGKEESYLWMVGKNSFDVFVLPKREILESRIEKLRKLLISREIKPNEEIDLYQKRIAENERLYWQEAKVLSNHLFGKIASKIRDKKLIIVADGKLRYFPISALPFPTEDKNSNSFEPFLLTNEIVYAPSASTLSLIRKSSESPKLPQKDLLVFADPIFSEEDIRLSKSKETQKTELASNSPSPFWTNFRSMESLKSLKRLPASGRESKSILQIVGESKSELISGFSANRKKFLDTDIQNYKILHFATHGFLNEERPELSGIVLSQYDQQGNKHDGFIRLQDIYGLNLSADMVVLSACDTGIGKEIKGEGLMSLTNGFLQVGAKTVISSRWKVDDEATFEIMKHFYRFLVAEKLTPSEALRKAQIKLRENPRFKSPFYWAAFTVHGDFQNKPKLSRRFDFSNYFLLIITIFIFFGIYRSYTYFR